MNVRPLAFQCYLHNLKPYEEKTEHIDLKASDELNYETISSEELKLKKLNYQWPDSSTTMLCHWVQHEKNVIMNVST